MITNHSIGIEIRAVDDSFIKQVSNFGNFFPVRQVENGLSLCGVHVHWQR